MKKIAFRQIFFWFGVITIIITFLPLLPADYWWVRMWGFPHLQVTALTFFAILLYSIIFSFQKKKDVVLLSVLIGCFVYQFSVIVSFTPLYKKDVLSATNSQKDRRVKILTANVLQKNENNHKLVALIKNLNADIMVFTEADSLWQKAINKGLGKKYAYSVELPLSNTYGMLLYSKYELIDPEIKFMVTDTIPSIHTKFKMPTGELIQLYAIHPTPPMPQENPLSTDRDAEMMLTARLARESEIPVIVIGDLNDIPWSDTSKLFKNTAELLDIRIGRGFYSTYNAEKTLLRWPLDHIYVTPEFRVSDIRVEEAIDSDHFPYYASLDFEPEGAQEQLPDPATEKELKRAQEQIDKLKEKKKK
ncbi:endonuclease/exonuclease/phosphatase family protein [Aequorivita lipolytica]|uniref:Endonuclease/exonuclease/phosphatase family protein n=1 Tax=Aequorivita lipolytica TaxID=153267 RepID=A0A5C6YPF7_9FLAO|nr:endonuclease/exonuclease/phosphatase family protein [Aequorivita lipolytica]TXD69107.1 endonuclease/exonuclease/phosphatase family protein [Aequorivita lipolytica]SRX51320.1 hypothetical protein AEQU2_01800 [Aequorivita lipolytica]